MRRLYGFPRSPNAPTEQLRACLQCVDPNLLQAWPVAPQVNIPEFDQPICIKPIGAIKSALDILPAKPAPTIPGIQAEP